MARSFRMLGTLGRGAFGEVHLTEIRTEDDFVQTLAVKWLHPELSEDAELAGRLRDEARLLGLLDHPNIVRVQGLTRLDGRLAVLMEAVHGCNLSRRQLPPRAAGQLVSAVADALHAAFTAVPPGRTEPLRVVHRDIKPSNIMVTRRGLVKVMDFGVARATFEAREVATRSQQYGTARYMAPERWLEGVAEAPSDVFSLGVTLVELVSGLPLPRLRLSRQGFAEDAAAAVQRIEHAELAALTADMLAFEPAGRPDAAAIVDRLATMSLPGAPLADWASSLTVAPLQTSQETGSVVVEVTGDTIALTSTGATETAATAATGPTGPAPPAAGPPQTVDTAVPALSHTTLAPAGSAPTGRWTTALPLLALGAILALGASWWGWSSTPRPTAPPLTMATPAPELPPPMPAEPTPAPAAPAPEVPPPEAPTPRPPTPAPAATPVPVAPVPAARPAVPTPVAPANEPAEADTPAPRIPITFKVDGGLSVRTPFGQLGGGRGVLMLPANEVVRLAVSGPSGSFACVIPPTAAPTTYAVRAGGRCGDE